MKQGYKDAQISAVCCVDIAVTVVLEYAAMYTRTVRVNE